jgi:hypothetical protein
VIPSPGAIENQYGGIFSSKCVYAFLSGHGLVGKKVYLSCCAIEVKVPAD